MCTTLNKFKQTSLYKLSIKIIYVDYDVTVDDEAIEAPPTKKQKKAAEKAAQGELAEGGWRYSLNLV